jgi:hypothetical protein
MTITKRQKEKLLAAGASFVGTKKIEFKGSKFPKKTDPKLRKIIHNILPKLGEDEVYGYYIIGKTENLYTYEINKVKKKKCEKE